MVGFVEQVSGFGRKFIPSFLGKAINQDSHVEVTGTLEGVLPNFSGLWAGLM